jgi:hypothetical protein
MKCHYSQSGAISEAYRLLDSLEVVLKIVDTSETYEVDILSYLHKSPAAQDPRNKIIPILEIIPLADEVVIVVMEAWSQRWSDPYIMTWEEFLDFGHQVLEVRVT